MARIGLCVQAMGGSFKFNENDAIGLLEKFLPLNLKELEVKGIDPLYLAVQANNLGQVQFWRNAGLPLDKVYMDNVSLLELAKRHGADSKVYKYLVKELKQTPPKPANPSVKHSF